MKMDSNSQKKKKNTSAGAAVNVTFGSTIPVIALNDCKDVDFNLINTPSLKFFGQ